MFDKIMNAWIRDAGFHFCWILPAAVILAGIFGP